MTLFLFHLFLQNLLYTTQYEFKLGQQQRFQTVQPCA